MSLHYKHRDLARDLYANQDWSLAELENKFNCKMTDYIIPQWMIRKREGYQLAKQQREARDRAKWLRALHRREAKLKLERQNQCRRLRKQDAQQVKELSTKIRQFDMKSVLKNIKRCPTNQFLMGGQHGGKRQSK